MIMEVLDGYIGRLKTACIDNRSKSKPQSESALVIFQSFVGSFIGILILSRIDKIFAFDNIDKVMIVGSFGAQATLIFATPSSPLAQPWNCIVGNGLSGIIGVSIYKLFDGPFGPIEDTFWLASACAVAISIAFMQLTRSLHPPGS